MPTTARSTRGRPRRRPGVRRVGRGRLPTEDEWQLAARAGPDSAAAPEVWNLTESEHTDGRTRFVMLKGGSARTDRVSDWYFDGGVRAPGVHARSTSCRASDWAARRASGSGWPGTSPTRVDVRRSRMTGALDGPARRRRVDAVRRPDGGDAPRRHRGRRGQGRAPAPSRPGPRSRAREGRAQPVVEDARPQQASVQLDLSSRGRRRGVPAAGRHGGRRDRELPARHPRALGTRLRRAVSADNPRLVLARITGFGQIGPVPAPPGFGTLAEAMSGFAATTGEPDGPPIAAAVRSGRRDRLSRNGVRDHVGAPPAQQPRARAGGRRRDRRADHGHVGAADLSLGPAAHVRRDSATARRTTRRATPTAPPTATGWPSPPARRPSPSG